MSLYHAIFGYSYDLNGIEDNYGLEAICDFFGNYWLDNVFHFNFVSIVNTFAIIYPIYYFISSNKSKQAKDERRLRKINLRKILFVISITCWIVYFMSGIYAFFFGCNVGDLWIMK